MTTTGGVSTDGGSEDDVGVLVVDDDPGMRQLLAEVLPRFDGRITVSTEPDAGAALDRLADEEFDCVVSDYEMPGTDGVAFLEAVRESRPRLPFVLFTGRDDETVASAAVAADAATYLPKDGGGDQFDLLADRLLDLVERRRAERRARRQERLNDLLRRVDRVLVRESTREDIERAVCETLADCGLYGTAWAGAGTEDGLRVRAAAADVDPGLYRVGTTPAAVAGVDAGDVVVGGAATDGEGLVAEASSEEVVRDVYDAYAAVPLRHAGRSFGALVVYTDRPDAFDDDEVALLSDLGRTVAHAIHASETTRALRESRDRAEALFENSSDAVVYVEYVEGEPIVRDVNPAFQATFGVDADEAVGMHVDDVVAPADRRPEAAAISRRARKGRGVEEEVTRRTVDGPREFLLRSVPLERGSVGQYSYAVYTDITERRRREDGLERLNRRVSRLHQSATALQSAASKAEVHEAVIDAAVDILAFDWCVFSVPDGEEFELQAVSEGAPFEAGDRPMRVDEGVCGRTLATGETDVTDDIHADEDSRPADDALRSGLTVPVGDYGVVQAVSTEPAAFDDDDRELAELLAAHAREALARIEREAELERQNERLEQFASVVSHDLRNPLNIAAGRVALAREDGTLAHLEDVETALDRMDAIIEDVLTLTRAEVDDTGPVSVESVAETAWSMVDTGEATLRADDAVVVADSKRLQRLFENLFRNAVEHARDGSTTDGTAHRSVRVERLDDGFAVVDDGPGFDDPDGVFETGYTTDPEGTGLGLAIVQRIAEAHGWTCAASNDPETGGARVTVRGVESLNDRSAAAP